MSVKKVAIIFGGVSSEHEVSLHSSASVLRRIPRDKYEPVMLGITRDGRWLLYRGGVDKIESGEWESDAANVPAVISPDRAHHGIIALNNSGAEIIRIDLAFPVMHGRNGEDGRIQGLFQLAGIPFVGCDTLSSAVCMDKAVTNALLDHFDIARCPWALINAHERADAETHMDEWEERFGYPMFVKPANAGSSVGITKAHDRAQLREALALAFEHDDKVLVEKNVSGKELECAVLGSDDPIASLVGEIVPANEFYDYEAKYANAESKTIIPARITAPQQAKIQQQAVRAFRLLGCSGLARVDFLLDAQSGEIYLNELNTIPGFTSISMYSKMLEASGISYPEQLSRLFELALERKDI